MTKCKDGRKHIIVKEYKKKDGTDVHTHERGCPTKDSGNASVIAVFPPPTTTTGLFL